MKKSVFKSGLVAAIAVVMMSCTTTANAQTGNTKYIYGQDDTNTTVYTLNEDGKTLTRKLKYEYKHDENGQVIEKKAYRWDAYRELWKPAYLLTVTPGAYETKLNYAEWNVKESTFNNNKQYCSSSNQSECRSHCFHAQQFSDTMQPSLHFETFLFLFQNHIFWLNSS